MRRLVLLSMFLLALAGCGGGGGDEVRTERSESPEPAPTPPTATAPSAPEPPTDIPPETPTETPTESPSPEAQEGGAGDEEAARIRVHVTIDGEGITPPTVTVAPFLALELVVRNDTLRRQTLRFRGRRRSVPAGRTGRLRVPGVRPGGYEIDAGPAGRTRLVAAPKG